MDIRPVQPDDVEAMRNIADETGLFPSEMLDDMIAGYFDGSKQDIWFAAAAEDGVVAFGFCEPERMTEGTWNFLAVAVLPACQGTGIGASMIRYLENNLQKQGGRVLLVETLGSPEFERTRRFYRQNGFTEEARIRDFYEEGADKVVFWKRVAN